MGPDHHHHAPQASQLNRAFTIGIVLNLLFVVIEAIAGIYSHSLALLTDAGHNLSDVATLALALLAFRLAKVKSSTTYTYGFQKTTILVALANAVILLVAIGSIGWEAARRLLHPQPLPGNIIAIVAAVGIVINTITALLFFRDKDKDLNVRGAYLHLAADAAVSVGVVASGIIIIYTSWYWLDSIISFVIMIVIFIGTWKLLKDTVRLSLDGVPHNVNVEEIRKAAKDIPGVQDIHHIHIWAMSTTNNALTAHIVVAENNTLADTEKIKLEFKHFLQHQNIQHVTLEIELMNKGCSDEHCD
jgi:cobalt-zinc-cadmium efflux system protein